MMTQTKTPRGYASYPRSQLLHRLSRAPILMSRMGFGPLFGRLFMVIATWGRKSGLPRYAMIDQIEIDGGLYAWSGHGPHSDWYRNVAANPFATVQTATQTLHVRARRVTDVDQLTQLLDRFRQTHPLRARSYFKAYGIGPDLADIAEIHDNVYLLALDPTDESTPPPLRADLGWVWLLLLVSGVAWWISRRRA